MQTTNLFALSPNIHAVLKRKTLNFCTCVIRQYSVGLLVKGYPIAYPSKDLIYYPPLELTRYTGQRVTNTWFQLLGIQKILFRFLVGLLSFPFSLAFLVGFVASPLRDVGVGFEEPHLRLMLYFVESGFPRIVPYFCIYGSSEWASVRRYCLEYP